MIPNQPFDFAEITIMLICADYDEKSMSIAGEATPGPFSQLLVAVRYTCHRMPLPHSPGGDDGRACTGEFRPLTAGTITPFPASDLAVEMDPLTSMIELGGLRPDSEESGLLRHGGERIVDRAAVLGSVASGGECPDALFGLRDLGWAWTASTIHAWNNRHGIDFPQRPAVLRSLV